MLATALVQGGQPLVYFACPVADFLVFDRVRSPVDLDDNDDFEETVKCISLRELIENLAPPKFSIRGGN